jgi:hypothetical protein
LASLRGAGPQDLLIECYVGAGTIDRSNVGYAADTTMVAVDGWVSLYSNNQLIESIPVWR